MKNSARYDWKHGISKNISYNKNGVMVKKSDNYRRISLTFRSVN